MSLPRAELLIRTRRYADAEDALREALREDPDDAEAHLLLGHCHLQAKDLPAARREAGEAIRLAPGDARPFLLRASVELAGRRPEAAVEAAHEARRRAPDWAEPLNLLAQHEARRERWPEVLAHAEEALALDPENPAASGLRTLALTHLGRAGEAAGAAARGLAQDPHDPDAHVVRGVTLLHGGEAKQAEAAFLEALRLEPGHEGAAAGLVMALKRRSRVLRPVFAFFFWMQRIPPRVRAGLIVGAWLLFQLLSRASDANPALRPLVLPLLIAYGAFCVLTWVADPLMNLALRLHPVGRHALSPQDRLSGTLFGAGTLGALGAVTGHFCPVPGAEDLLVSAAACFLAGVFAGWGIGFPAGGHRKVLLGCAATLAAVAVGVWVASAAGLAGLAGLLLLAGAAAAILGFLAPLTRNLSR